MLVAGSPSQVAFIAQVKSTQNAFVESFIGRLQDACLNETLFNSLVHAWFRLAVWRLNYNTVRPQSKLGEKTPPRSQANRFGGMTPDRLPYHQIPIN